MRKKSPIFKKIIKKNKINETDQEQNKKMSLILREIGRLKKQIIAF